MEHGPVNQSTDSARPLCVVRTFGPDWSGVIVIVFLEQFVNIIICNMLSLLFICLHIFVYEPLCVPDFCRPVIEKVQVTNMACM